jgi:hypothetical protein
MAGLVPAIHAVRRIDRAQVRAIIPDLTVLADQYQVNNFVRIAKRIADFMRRTKGHPKKLPTMLTLPPPPQAQQSSLKPEVCSKVLRTLGKALGWLGLKLLPSFLLWASVVMTLVAGAFFFLPRVTIESSGPYDPSNPSPVTFVISNINIIPLRDVQPSIGICYLGILGGNRMNGANCTGPSESVFDFTRWRIHWLAADEKYQIAIEDVMRLPDARQFDDADITISVTFTPWYMPWHTTKEFRFITTKRSDGKIYWTPVPLNP